MKILFAASEANPILKVGGIADVVGSLGKEIKNSGHDLRIIIPFYQTLKNRTDLNKISSFTIRMGGNWETVEIFQTLLPGHIETANIPVYLLKNDRYLSDRGVYLENQEFFHLARFLFFSKAVTEIFENIDWVPEIIHCHDWQAGTIPLFLKIKGRKRAETRKIKTLFTIHNLLTQGCWDFSSVLKFLELKGTETTSLSERSPGPYGDNFNVIQQAILNADLINTVSPSYGREIKTKTYYARGLDKIIQKRKQDIFGIINGIDTELFDPATDKCVKKNYSFKTINLKGIDKTDLQKETGLEEKSDPLLAVVSRLDIQKGIDLIYQSIDRIIRKGAQMIFLGEGQKKYESMLQQVAKKYPKQIAVYIKFDPDLAQKIYAGADIFLMPSRFEPCGLSQLIAMRYGTIPVVRKTGGLADTVENMRFATRINPFKKRIRGTGFVFEKYSPQDFMVGINRAIDTYHQKGLWQQLQKNAMKKDFSWKQSAKKYLKLYSKITF